MLFTIFELCFSQLIALLNLLYLSFLFLNSLDLFFWFPLQLTKLFLQLLNFAILLLTVFGFEIFIPGFSHLFQFFLLFLQNLHLFFEILKLCLLLSNFFQIELVNQNFTQLPDLVFIFLDFALLLPDLSLKLFNLLIFLLLAQIPLASLLFLCSDFLGQQGQLLQLSFQAQMLFHQLIRSTNKQRLYYEIWAFFEWPCLCLFLSLVGDFCLGSIRLSSCNKHCSWSSNPY